MARPFKMKGNPMQRNFGISPMKDTLGEPGSVSREGHNKIYGVGHNATTYEEHKALLKSNKKPETKGSPTLDKKSRARRKAIRKYKRNTVVIDGKTYDKSHVKEVEAKNKEYRRKKAIEAVNASKYNQ